MAVSGFYWLIEGELAGCGRPGGPDAGGGRRRPMERDGTPGDVQHLEEDLSWLRGQGIGAILTLTESPLDAALLAAHGFAVLHLPVEDMTAPTPNQLQRALAFIDWQRALGRSVAVHCRMGQGRTATVLGAHRIRDGMGVDAAIRELRAICPGALGSPSQEQALRAFARRRDWVL